METVCPVCNGLQEITAICPLCGEVLLDGGTIESFLGPYAPYMYIEDLMANSENYCIHLLFCPDCHYDTRQAWDLVII